MSGPVEFDPATGTLLLPAAALPALRALVADEGDAAVGAAFGPSGALADGAVHPALAPALGAMRAPVCTLVLQRGERSGEGWVDPRLAVLLVPEPDGRLRLAALPTQFLPAALARMNELGPRPRPARSERLVRTSGELAELLAGPARDRRFARLREHWRVDAGWEPAEGSAGRRGVEVVDTDDGLWLVVPDAPTVELWTVTPTTVWRLLAALLPRDEELG